MKVLSRPGCWILRPPGDVLRPRPHQDNLHTLRSSSLAVLGQDGGLSDRLLLQPQPYTDHWQVTDRGGVNWYKHFYY